MALLVSDKKASPDELRTRVDELEDLLSGRDRLIAELKVIIEGKEQKYAELQKLIFGPKSERIVSDDPKQGVFVFN